jgi:beta-galactosidase
VGLELEAPKGLEQVRWLGLGPHETYPDRKHSGLKDVHTAHVKDLHTPYVVPSESHAVALDLLDSRAGTADG